MDNDQVMTVHDDNNNNNNHHTNDAIMEDIIITNQHTTHTTLSAPPPPATILFSSDGLIRRIPITLNPQTIALLRSLPGLHIEFDDANVQAMVFPSPSRLSALHDKTAHYHQRSMLWGRQGFLGQDLPLDHAGCLAEPYNAMILPMDDSSPLFTYASTNTTTDSRGEYWSLFEKYETDGYLLLKGILPPTEIQDAVNALVDTMRQAWAVDVDEMEMRVSTRPARDPTKKDVALRKGAPASEKDICCEFSSENEVWNVAGPGVLCTEQEYGLWMKLLQSSQMHALNSHPILSHVMTQLADGATRRYIAGGGGGSQQQSEHRFEAKDCNLGFLRVRGRGFCTPEHADFYEMKEREQLNRELNLVTAREVSDQSMDKAPPQFNVAMWIPLGPFPLLDGAIAVLPGSHHFSGYLKGALKKPTGFVHQAKGKPWAIAQLEVGDVLLIDSQTVSATCTNRDHLFYRASFDKRVVLGMTHHVPR